MDDVKKGTCQAFVSGNWRTIHIIGTLSLEDFPTLRRALEPGEHYENLHCLSDNHSLAGLGNWANLAIDAIGNLAERGYTVKDIAQTAAFLALIAPSLNIFIHCGGDYESQTVVNTIRVTEGTVTIMSPLVKIVGDLPIKDISKPGGCFEETTGNGYQHE